MGHHPNICNASDGAKFAVLVKLYSAAAEATMQARVTVRIRARITLGASRLSVGEGRVAADK